MQRWVVRLKIRSNAANVGWVVLVGLVNLHCVVINERSIFLTGDDINNDTMDFLLDMPNKFTLFCNAAQIVCSTVSHAGWHSEWEQVNVDG